MSAVLDANGKPVETTTKAKPKAEVTNVVMSDGRTVGFAGKRKMVKETLIDEGKILLDGDTITIQAGAITTRLDFRNGETRTFAPTLKLIPKFTGHGAEQKLGDETAGEDKVEDMVLSVDDLIGRLSAGEWNVPSEGGFGGASIVIKAIMEASEATMKDAEGVLLPAPVRLEKVKAFLQGKLDKAKAAGQKLTRQELYASFRNPTSKTGQIIERMEREERSKASKVDADAALAEMAA